MKKKPVSLRQRLDSMVGNGELRQALERAGVKDDLIEYTVDVIGRYCAPRITRKKYKL